MNRTIRMWARTILLTTLVAATTVSCGEKEYTTEMRDDGTCDVRHESSVFGVVISSSSEETKHCPDPYADIEDELFDAVNVSDWCVRAKTNEGYERAVKAQNTDCEQAYQNEARLQICLSTSRALNRRAC